MDENSLDDLKKFIALAIFEQISDVCADIKSLDEGLKADIKELDEKLSSKIDTLSQSVAEALENTMSLQMNNLKIMSNA